MTDGAAGLRVVTVSGSLRSPSTTDALLAALVNELAAHRTVAVEAIALGPLATDLASAITGGAASVAVESALASVASADLLIVATPIYRGSYTGLFKLFFDLLQQDALAGTPVLLAAGGGNDQHSLAIDHELRPLFAFFRAATLPVGVFARGADYGRDKSIDPAGVLPGAIERAVASALPWLSVRRPVHAGGSATPVT